MASLPAIRDPATLTEREEGFREAIAELIFLGHQPHEIAKMVYPEDEVKRKRLRNKLRRWVREDADFHARVAARAHGEMVVGLGPSVRALVRRASRGNPQALKLLFEASGFHNPKMKHEHSGEVKIKLEMPRPPVVEDEAGPVTDAEVVED